MLFSVTGAPAPLNPVATSKPKAVQLQIDRKDVISIAGYDPWFEEFFWKRYPTNTDATNDTNGVIVARGADAIQNDTSELTKGTTYYYRCYYLDIYDNASAFSSTVNVVYRGANDGDVDKTNPNAPTLSSLVQVNKDTDTGDGRIEIAILATYAPPGSGVEVKRYIIEVNDGSVTAIYYSKKNNVKFPAVAGKTYTVKVSAESIFGEEGPQSSSLNITPTGKTIAPGSPTGVAASAAPGGLGFYMVWDQPTDPDYSYTEIANLSSPGTPVQSDVFASRSQGYGFVYFPIDGSTYIYVRHVNRSGQKTSWILASGSPLSIVLATAGNIDMDVGNTGNSTINVGLGDETILIASFKATSNTGGVTVNVGPTSYTVDFVNQAPVTLCTSVSGGGSFSLTKSGGGTWANARLIGLTINNP